MKANTIITDEATRTQEGIPEHAECQLDFYAYKIISAQDLKYFLEEDTPRP